ncbi:hypothetical protein RFUL19S_04359 [Rhizobacter fulvus]
MALKTKIVEIAHTRRRFGYRRVHDLLRPDFPGANHKRVYRLYTEANLTVRKRKEVRRPPAERRPLNIAAQVNEVWSMDFVSDSLANGKRLKCLTVADDFSHEAVDIAVDYGISGQYVIRLLDQAARFRGYPAAVRTDSGPEFTSRAFIAWAQSHGIRHILIEPGRPMQNGYIESFNGRFRDASTGSRRCIKRAKRSRHGASTTTRRGLTGALGVCHRPGSPSSIAGMPAMLLNRSHQPTTRSSNLQPGLLPQHWYGGWGQVNRGMLAVSARFGVW